MRTCIRVSLGVILVGALLSLSSCGGVPHTDISTFYLMPPSPPLYQEGDKGYVNLHTTLDPRYNGLNWPNVTLSGALRIDTHFLVLGRFGIARDVGDYYAPRMHGKGGMLALGFAAYKQAKPNKFLLDLYLGAEKGAYFSQESYSYDQKNTKIRYRWDSDRYFLLGVMRYSTRESTTIYGTGQIGGMSVKHFRVLEQSPANVLPQDLPLNGQGYTPVSFSIGLQVGGDKLRLSLSAGYGYDHLAYKSRDPNNNLLFEPPHYQNYAYLMGGLNYYFLAK